MTILTVCLFIGAGCGGDDVSCTVDEFNSEVAAAVNDLNTAGQTWANDPSTDNCNKWRDAANDYLDAVEKFEGCDVFDQAQYQQAVDLARDAVNSVTCN